MRFMKKIALAALLSLCIVGLADDAGAMSQVSSLTCNLQASGTATINGFSASLPLAYAKTIALANGNGANQASTLYANTGATIAASGSTNYDLSGVLTDFTGTVITFTKIKLIEVCAATGNTNTVNVGGAGANAFVGSFGSTTDVVKVNPGGCLVMIAPDSNGYAVTAGTGDLLKVANGGAGTSVTYDVLFIGI